MNLIFYGFLVMLLGIEVNGISLAPLFQIGGYALVMQGINAVDKENKFFKRALPLIYALMVLNGLSFVMDVTNIVAVAMPVGLANGIVSLMAVYNVLKGIQVYNDELQTPNLTTKMYKRWRLSVILVVATAVVGLIGVVIMITSVPMATFFELVTQLATNPASEAIAVELGELMMPFAGVTFALIFLIFILAITAFVFHILFLVSLYNVQKEFALRTPVDSTPTDFPNPQ